MNSLKAGFFLNPHHQKKHKGGEDACALADNMLAVADGVGGWAESGIDPAIYSKRLCSL
jgi:protein phosphatase PTC7